MTKIQASANTEVDEVIEATCVVLQLTPTQFSNAQDRYAGVDRFLHRKGGPVEPYIPALYPQGSMAQRTTIRPMDREEFDLDIVCCLQAYSDGQSSDRLYRMILDDLRSNGNYRDLVEPQKRCIRLNYKGEFHLDIVPACPDTSRGDTAILIPDVDLSGWVQSDPKAYAEWFNAIGKTVQSKSRGRGIAASSEPVPDNGHAFDRLPLQRTVQLMKRRRSVYYKDKDSELAPKSIVLSTLAGDHYGQQELCTDALLVILNRILDTHAGSPHIVVRNPVDRKEILTRDWTNEQGLVFLDFIRDFRDRMVRLLRTSNLAQMGEQLNDLFGVTPRGEDVGTLALKRYGDQLREKRDNNQLGLTTTGAITLLTPGKEAACKVTKNTFFGR